MNLQQLTGEVKRLEALVALALARGQQGGSSSPNDAFVNVVTAFGVDNTGGTDVGGHVTVAYAALAVRGQTAWFPKGTYLVNTPAVNAGGVASLFAQGAVFTGPQAASIEVAASGAVITADTPSIYPALAISQKAHESLYLWQAMPSDGHPPYQMTLESFFFNATWDNVMHWGFNVLGPLTTTKPQAYWTIEQDFEVSPGVHTIEAHMEISDPLLHSGFYRPFTCNYKVGVGTLVAGFQYSDLGGPGSISIVEISTDSIQCEWLTGQMQFQPTNYVINATDGLTIASNTNGSFVELLVGTSGPQDAFTVDGTNHRSAFFQAGGNTLYVDLAGVHFFATNTAPILTADAQTTDVAVPTILVQGGTPFGAATGTHRNAGNVRIAIQAPAAGGAAGYLELENAGALIGQFSTAFGAGALWLSAAVAPTTTNYTVTGDGASYAQLNAPTGGEAQLAVAGSAKVTASASLVTIAQPVDLEGQTTASSATIGAASALPGLPAGYLEATVNGSSVKIPYYNP